MHHFPSNFIGRTASCRLVVLALAAFGLALGGSLAVAERIGDFSLIDADGRFFQLSRHSDRAAVVFVAYEQGHRDARRAAADLTQLAEEFGGRGVTFALIDATAVVAAGSAAASAATEALRAEIARHGIATRVLMDDTQLVTAELGLTRVGEAAVVLPATRELAYRGALGSRHAAGSRAERREAGYVAEALTAILDGGDGGDGGERPAGTLAAKGEPLDLPAVAAVSYTEDIAPILEARCVSCHQDGGIAPFAMSGHQMLRGWSPMIRETLITKRMPPGQIDREYVDDFEAVNHITSEETRQLVAWIDQGAPRDGEADPLANLATEPVKWLGGTPDMILAIPPQQIPATGVQDYRNVRIPLEIEEDVWVKAIEFEAGDPTVLHHIIAFSYGPGGVNEFEILNQGIGLGAYAPGYELNTYPEGAGYPLKKGGGLMLQLHYTTSGKETVDASEIALYLWDGEPEKVIYGGSAAELDIDIPPFSTKEMVAVKTFRKDALLTMLGPHMHYRGYDANFKLRYPDGREEEILNVPNYQFNWQRAYDFKEPRFLPAGTELIFRGTFDNTATNPFNPDASQTLSWGEQTWQEMFFGFFRYLDADAGD